MIIQENDYRKAVEYLGELQEKGEKYIAYDCSSLPVDIKSLPTFRTNYQAMEYCYERSTDLDVVSYLAVPSAYQALHEGINDQSILIKINGNIDVSLTTLFYTATEFDRQLDNNQNKEIKNENSNNKDKEPKVENTLQMGKEGSSIQQKSISEQKENRKSPPKKRGFRH